MGLTFQDPKPDGKQQPRLRRVPDYQSRPMRMRLFALVAALMLVLLVAEKARDPQSWRWFFALDERPVPAKIDNRLPPQTRTTAGEPIDTVVIAGGDNDDSQQTSDDTGAPAPPTAKSPAKKKERDPAAKAWTHGLKALWEELPSQERTLLFRLLESAQQERLWPKEERAAAESLVAMLRQRWTDYHADAFQALADLEEGELAHWQEVLSQINSRFSEECLAPLETLAAGRVVLPGERQQLASVLTDLRTICLDRVKDDAPFMQPNDNQIWHHLFWQLQHADAAELAARSQGEIAYAQLYRQPAVYRGEVVTVRGEARRAYRVRASRNHLGIDEYYVFWLQPFASADTPLVVYALELPPGFPAVKDRDREGMTRLQEVVTFQGYLFKRGAYAGQQGTYNAPLLLARAPQWKPAVAALDNAEPAGLRIMWRSGIAALVVAVLIVSAVYLMTFRRPRNTLPRDELAVSATLRSLQDQPVKSPSEALRDMEQSAQVAQGRAKDA